MEEKLLLLFKQQRIYWKQRGTIKWVTQGDAGTKFFHANATIKHRKNLITTLEDQNGAMHSVHKEKADILWDSFKDRLGRSEFKALSLDLNSLLQASNNLGCLEMPFTIEEIDNVIQQLSIDKSPGPDDFNTDFVKKCCPSSNKISTTCVKPSLTERYASTTSMDLTLPSSQKQMVQSDLQILDLSLS